jgi:ABC-type transport system substrate-binding protein
MDMNMRRSTLLFIVIAMALAMAMSCKPKKKDADSVNKDGKAKKVFNYFRSTDFKSIDPPRQFDAASGEIIMQVYDPLIEYHYLKRPYEMVPNLLANMPTLSDDGLTFSFELRKGIKFHDDECFPDGKGRELVADDVLYTLKRYADPNVNTRSYDTLLGKRVKGLDEYREKARANKDLDHTKEEVEGLKKTGTHTFTVTLTKKDPLALMPFAASALSIYPQEAVAKYGDKFERHPVGTGPFKLVKNPRRGTLVFERNPNYHLNYPTEGDPGDKDAGFLKDAGKQVPLVDELHMPLIEEAQPRMLKFLSGEIDWIGIDKDNFVKMAYKDDKGFQLNKEYAEKFDIYSADTLVLQYWQINMKDKLLGDCRDGAEGCDAAKNKALRQALAMTMDIPGFIEKMANGRGHRLNTMVPLPISGNEKDINFQYYKTDLEGAKAKLAEAGYPDGKGLPEITIEFRSTTNIMRQYFEFHRAQAAKVGITLKGNFQTFTAYLKKVEAANFQIASGGWQADYPDPENFYQLLYGPNKAPGPNEGAFANAEYDKLYEEMKTMSPGPERNKKIARMAQILKDEVPALINYSNISVGLTQKWLKNMKRNFMLDLHVKFLDIDPEMKAKGLPK